MAAGQFSIEAADPIEHFVSSVEAAALSKCAERLESTLKEMTCATCKFRKHKPRGAFSGSYEVCMNPQSPVDMTTLSFGCLRWAASPPLEETK